MRDLAFLGAWLVLLPLALQGAQCGVLVWTWSSLLAPNDVLYGLAAGVPFSKIAALVTLVLALVGRGGGIRLRPTPTVMLMAALALLGLLSQSFGLAANSADGWDLYAKFAKILLLGVTVMAVMRDRLRLHGLLLAICLGIGFTGLGEGAKFLLSGAAHKILGTPSTGDNNQIGLDVLLIMPMLFYLYRTAQRRSLRIVGAVVAIMCGICVISSSSRAAFVGLVIEGIAFVLGSRRKVSGLIIVGVLALGGAQLVNTAWVSRMNTIETAAENDDSFMGRIGAWKESLVVAMERPVLGGGFHAIQQGDVWTAHRAEAMSITLFPAALPTMGARAAHSIYFEVLGDLGVTGLLLFVGLFVIGWRNATLVRRLVRRSGRPDLRWAGDLAWALQTSLAVFLIVGGSLSAAYYDIDYLLVAMLAVLRELVQTALATVTVPTGVGARPIAPGYGVASATLAPRGAASRV